MMRDKGFTSLVRSASIRTGVKEVMTLLVKSRRPISSAMEVSFSSGMYLVPLTSTRRI
jgi:hypothetical protein